MTNALDRCVWEMHHEGKIRAVEVSPRVFDINGGLIMVDAANRKITYKNGGVLIGDVYEFTRLNWRTKINALLKLEENAKELDFKDKEVPLF